jgi:amino-acid N-acetyltransferase
MKPVDYIISIATSGDYIKIIELLEKVSLPTVGVEEIIPEMLVLKDNNQITGCAALEMYGPFALLRSVAINKEYQRTGLGSMLVRAILKHAKARRVQELYLLTETAPSFFESHGFKIIDRNSLPETVKNSPEVSTICPQSAIAMRLNLY